MKRYLILSLALACGLAAAQGSPPVRLRATVESYTAPFLVIKLGLWSDSPAPENGKPPESGPSSSALQYEVPVSSNSKAIAAISNQEDGGQGEGEALLDEIRSTLGESDAAQFRPVLGHYPPAVIRQALGRVAKTPPNQIRKSKTALFRFLLSKLSSSKLP